MLVATFGPTTGWAGKSISYDNAEFVLEGVGVISAAAVLEYDRQGHLTWAYEGLREWTAGLAGGQTAVASASANQPSVSLTSSQATKSGHRGLKIAGIVAGAVVGAFMLLAILGAFIGGDSTSTSQSGSSSAVIATAAPTTAPPTPATSTTPSPTRAEASSEALTSKESSYLLDAGSSADDMSSAFTTIGELAGEWPWNDEQTIRIAGALATMQVTYDQWKNRDAPSPRMRRLHRLWLSALKTYDEAANRFAYGADNLDVDAISQANKLMEQGYRLLTKAGREMDGIASQFGE